MPKWRFQPLKDIHSAFSLLERAERYTIIYESSKFHVTVRTTEGSGCAARKDLPEAISYAFGKAIGLEASR